MMTSVPVCQLHSLGATGEEMGQGQTWLGAKNRGWLGMNSPHTLTTRIGTVKQSGCDLLTHTKSHCLAYVFILSRFAQ